MTFINNKYNNIDSLNTIDQYPCKKIHMTLVIIKSLIVYETNL